jgi:RNA polymerase sigma-70 factor (ECF subfamily)
MASTAILAQREERPTSDLQAIFQAEFSYVWNALRRLGVPARDLEDLTHDVFLRVHAEWHGYDPARPIRPWLFGFAFRIASDYRRLARNRLEIFGDASEREAVEPSGLEQVLRNEALCIASRALESLDIDRRAVFILHELDGVPVPAIAETLSISVNTAYSRLRMARQQFQETVHRLRMRQGDA